MDNKFKTKLILACKGWFCEKFDKPVLDCVKVIISEYTGCDITYYNNDLTPIYKYISRIVAECDFSKQELLSMMDKYIRTNENYRGWAFAKNFYTENTYETYINSLITVISNARISELNFDLDEYKDEILEKYGIEKVN